MSLICECESCKRSITQAELEAREALSFQGKHYCASCKAPVEAFMRRNLDGDEAAASPSADAKSDSPPAAPSQTASASANQGRGGSGAGAVRKAPGRRAPAAGGSRAGVKKTAAKTAKSQKSTKTASRLRSGKAGARTKEPGAVAKRPGLGQGRTAKKKTAGSTKTGSKAASKTGPGKSIGSSPRTGGAPGRKPGKRPPLRATRRRTGRFGARGRGGDDDLDFDEGQVQESGRGRAPLWIAGSIAGVVVVVAAAFLANQQDSSDSQAGSGTSSGALQPIPEVTLAEAESARIEEEMKRDKDLLTQLRDRFVGENDPLRLDSLLRSVNTAAYRVRSPDISAQIKILGNEVRSRRDRVVKGVFHKAKKESDALIKEDNYVVAIAVWENEPLAIQDSPYHSDWVAQRDQLERLAKKYTYWSTIALRVGKYLEQGHPDISIAIIEENIGSDYERNYPRIWKKRQSLLSKVRDAKGKALAEALEVARKEREKLEEIERRKQEKERQERWDKALGLIDWEPLISATGDLENWYQQFYYGGSLEKSYFAWFVDTEDEEGPFLTSGKKRHPVSIGYNGDRWQDWALKFEVQVPKKSLTMEVRRKLAGGQEKAERDLTFGKSYRKKWIPVYLEVRAQNIRFYKNADEETARNMKPTKTINCDHESGGFRFVLPKGGRVKIRNMQLKLVSDFAKGESEDDDDEDF